MNADETISVTATADVDWITIKEIGEDTVTYDVAANTGSSRVGKITLTYGTSNAVVTVNQAGISAMPIATIRAEARSDNSIWDLNIIEVKDALNNEYQSRITFKLAEGVSTRITDGTYSVADGTIIPNNSADSGSGSFYRYNGNGLSIYDATLNITVDKENETAKFNGVFKVAGGEYTFAWDGAVDGFVYQDLDAGITEWDYFYIYSHWDDTKYVVAYSGTIRFDWYLKKLGGKKSDPVAAGTYVVSAWESTTTKDYVDSSATKINGVLLQNGGVVTITEVAEGYEFTFDVTDVNGTNWKGTYVGPIDPNLYFNPYAN
jgi:hypothetical protein